MFGFKNRIDSELDEANFYARLSHSKQLLENINPMMLASFCSLTRYLQLECGPMPNLMVALPNIGGAVCSTPQSLADAHY